MFSRIAQTSRACCTLLAAAGLAVSLGGCSLLFPSPVTSYIDESGKSVTVRWENYPGLASIDQNDILLGPTIEEVPERSARLLGEARAAVSALLGKSDWKLNENSGTAVQGQEWISQENGYGKRSMLKLINEPEWQLETQLPRESWDAVRDAVEAVAEKNGLASTWNSDKDSEQFAWAVDRAFGRGGEFLSVQVHDVTLDSDAASDAQKYEWLRYGVTLSYGASALHQADVAEFTERAQSFAGLEHPQRID